MLNEIEAWQMDFFSPVGGKLSGISYELQATSAFRNIAQPLVACSL